MNKIFYVYILSNKNQTVFYTGVTNNLIRRVLEHKKVKGFTKKYGLTKLLYFKACKYIEDAIHREKQLNDLYSALVG